MKTPKGKHITCPACGKDVIIDKKNSQLHHKTPICDTFALHILVEGLLAELLSEKREKRIPNEMLN